MIVHIAYDYRMTIIIREYEICTEHKIHMDCLLRTWLKDIWACLLGKTSLQHTDQLAPFGSLQRLRALIDGHCLVQ